MEHRQRSSATCVCGHPRSAHEHYRPGSDCALCGPQACPRFRRRRWWRRAGPATTAAGSGTAAAAAATAGAA
jgi:hypothetical protein